MRPLTPVMLIRLLLKSSSPRATASRAAVRLSSSRRRRPVAALEPRPGREVREDDRAERNPLRIQPQRVVDPDVEILLRERLRSALRPLPAEISGGDVVDLGREEARLEVHDLLALLGRERNALGVSRRGAVRLVQEVERDRLPGERLAAVPHHGAEEGEVRGRGRTPEERELVAAREPVRIVHRVERELGVGRDADADPDEALVRSML